MVARCDNCGEPIYEGQEYGTVAFTVADEANAESIDFHVDCEEANSDGE